MPVLITGATGMVGRALADRLLAEGGQVRAYIRRDDTELRAAGVHIAIGEACNVERLESALTRVHTIVHLVGGLFPARGTSYHDLITESTECAVIAARSSEVRRFVYLSTPGADPDSDNEFLAARGRAERLVLESGMEHAIIRCTPIAESVPRWVRLMKRGPIITVPGTGDQRIGVVPLDEVVEAIVAADARDAEVRGVWDLGGEPITMRELVARSGVAGRAVFARGLSGVPRAAAEYLGNDIVVDSGPARAALGLS